MKILFTLFSLLLLASCASITEEIDPTANWTAEELYEHAKQALYLGNFEEATDYFESLEARYPFGKYAIQTQLEIAYAYYKNDEQISAIAALQRFIRFNPENKHLDYAYYLIGLANYRKGRGVLDAYLPRDFSDIDQNHLVNAFNAFKKLVTLYPKSKYSNDARLRMIYLRNKLAESELKIAKYYTRRGAHLASINRLRYLLSNYPSSPFIEDALTILKTNYSKIKQQDKVKEVEKLLSNYKKQPIYWRKS